MKLSRQYLLGLGSGLILSALLSMVLLPTHVTAPKTVSPSRTSPAGNTESSLTPADSGPASGGSGAETAMPPTGSGSASPSGTSQGSPQTVKAGSREFVIPSGASAEKIAGLLQEQGFVADKEAFLDTVTKRRVASRFQAGTFILTENLNVEEILDALIAPQRH